MCEGLFLVEFLRFGILGLRVFLKIVHVLTILGTYGLRLRDRQLDGGDLILRNSLSFRQT